MFISDKCLGLVESIAEYYPDADWQRCTVHFYRNVWSKVPSTKINIVVPMLKAIHSQEDGDASREKAKQVIVKLKTMKLVEAAKIIEEGINETLTYTKYPRTHWRNLRTNNPIERLMREIRRRTNVVGNFPDGDSALILVSARLRYLAAKKWGMKRYMNIDLLRGYSVKEVA